MTECGKEIAAANEKKSGGAKANLENPDPLVAYVLLWFPLSSETFIFREIQQLEKHGLRLEVCTLYGKALKGCSDAMKNYPGSVWRLGVAGIGKIGGAFFRALWKEPRKVFNVARRGLFRRMRNLEALGENIWSFFAGFCLAEKCKKDKVALIHSAWANGPATAAWVASIMSGIPFAFTGRAGDIYPQDGILGEKARDALFIRTNNAANVLWLKSFCPEGQGEKVKLVYNSLAFPQKPARPEKKPSKPYKILAVGRFVRTKGFPYLLSALARLRRENFPVRLTLVGDGAWRPRLEKMVKRLKLASCVNMPGFLPNDEMPSLMREHDLVVVPSVVHNNGDRDGIPNVIMEALASGTPVVATDVCGISEIIQNEKTGFLVPQRDAAALASAIRGTLENWPKAVKMASAGHELVRNMFDPQKNSLLLKDLYLASLGIRTDGKP